MRFTFVTEHNQAAMTAMAKALRKTLRKQSSRRVRVFGWAIVAAQLFFLLVPPKGIWVMNINTVLNLVILVIMLAVLLFEDYLNGYIARRRLLSGVRSGTTVFTEDGYAFQCDVAQSEWKYDAIQQVVDTGAYFVLAFSANHAQVYAKAGLQDASPEEFAAFLERKIGKPVKKL